MKSKDATQALLDALPQITPSGLRESRLQWNETNIMRLVINYEADQLVAEYHNALESCKTEELQSLQGKIQAIRQFQGKINEQHTTATPIPR